MSPEKVAVVVVTGLIAILLGVALFHTEPAEAAEKPGVTVAKKPEAPKPAPLKFDSLSYDDIAKGKAKTWKAPKPTTSADPEKPETIDYTIKRNDRLAGIARRELGDAGLVRKILELNPGLDANKLKEGQIIKLPVVTTTKKTDAAANAADDATTSKGNKTTTKKKPTSGSASKSHPKTAA